MAKRKSLPQEAKTRIGKINSKLKSIYNTYGYSGDYAQNIRKELSTYVPMTKKGAISIAPKGYDLTTLDNTVRMIENKVPTGKDLKSEAILRLQGTYNARAKKYKQPVEQITQEAIVQQVNAQSYLDKMMSESFDKMYETWLHTSGDKIYDKALEEKLDELFRKGDKHIWSDAEFAEAFRSLYEYNQLIQ